MTAMDSRGAIEDQPGVIAGAVLCILLSSTAIDNAYCADAVRQDDPLTMNASLMQIEAYDSGWSIQIDNDSFNGSSRDHDYTGGMAITFSGRRVLDFPISINPVLKWLDGYAGVHESGNSRLLPISNAMQIGLIAFTPDRLDASTPLLGDRPYASLVFLTNSRFSVDVARSVAHQSHLTFGVLGTPVAEWFQNGIHNLSGSTTPMGYSFQISNGGEPTALYALSRQSLLHTGFTNAGQFEVTRSAEVSIGYLTEANVSISARWGRFSTPWWTFASAQAAYIQQPGPSDITRHSRRWSDDRYFWAGVMLRFRLYNAFLQGQFRDSAVTLSRHRLEILIPEFTLGVSTRLSNRWQLTYSVRFQGGEIRSGPAARGMIWAEIALRRH